MVKLGIFYEQNKAGKDTGRVQVACIETELIYEVFDTEKEAEEAMVKLQAELDRNIKIEAEYLEWEKACMARHEISEEDLRVLLVNVVII